MKNTVKLILIIFFSIMYGQNIDLTWTTWECKNSSVGKFKIHFEGLYKTEKQLLKLKYYQDYSVSNQLLVYLH